MNVIIVAAGSGKRLLPLTEKSPKCLLEVGKKKIIDFTLEALKKHGMDDIVIVSGHKGEMIKKYLGKKVRYVINPIFERTNSLYSLSLAQQYFDAEFLYLHSDIIFAPDILNNIVQCDQNVCLAVDKKMVDKEDMKVGIENGLIKQVNKAIPHSEAVGEFIGIAKFRGEGILYLNNAMHDILRKRGDLNAYFEVAVEQIIRNGHKVFPLFIENKFYAEVDTIENLKSLEEIIATTDPL